MCLQSFLQKNLAALSPVQYGLIRGEGRPYSFCITHLSQCQFRVVVYVSIDDRISRTQLSAANAREFHIRMYSVLRDSQWPSIYYSETKIIEEENG